MQLRSGGISSRPQGRNENGWKDGIGKPLGQGAGGEPSVSRMEATATWFVDPVGAHRSLLADARAPRQSIRLKSVVRTGAISGEVQVGAWMAPHC